MKGYNERHFELKKTHKRRSKNSIKNKKYQQLKDKKNG